MQIRRNLAVGIFVTVTAALFVGMLFVAPISQPDSYHHFSDTRSFFGIPNALNVLSNAGFLVVGVAGLWFLLARSNESFISASERLSYLVLFFGILLTTFGSAYYHWSPSNETLVWDRLPMTFGFMGLFAGCLSERIGLRAGQLLLWPMVVVGILSVTYWQQTGDLRPYILVQFYSLIAIAMLIALFGPRYTRGGDIYIAIAFYALAKVLESYDKSIHATLRIVSGHTLKHIAAAAASFVLLRMLYKRKAIQQTLAVAASD